MGKLGAIKGFLNVLKVKDDELMSNNAVMALLDLFGSVEFNIDLFLWKGGDQLALQTKHPFF